MTNDQCLLRRREAGEGPARRAGKTLVLLAVAIPMLFGMLGLVLDGSLLMAEFRGLQQVADAAATAAARELARGESRATAISTAADFVRQHNGLTDAEVTVNIPPAAGDFAGEDGFVEVVVSRTVGTHFIHVIRSENSQRVRVRAVAGAEPATAGGAIVVLDPDPSPVAVSGLPPGFPPLPPTHLGGLEVLGAGPLRVEGAVFVNNEWGGFDENGDPAGEAPGPPFAISCTPALPLTSLLARDIRVTGGVDNPDNYGHVENGKASPLRANRLPVPDPLRELPVPTTSVDSANVSGEERGVVQVTSLPLAAPPVTLQPGVYEWIEITSGRVTFQPGVYIVRNVNPATGIALNISGGQIAAEGVMFYITDTADYSAATGARDANDGDSVPPPPGPSSAPPSVAINAALVGSRFSGLDDAGSPFHGVFLFQRRRLRRPIVIAVEQLLGGSALSGTFYAKWGQLDFAGHGTFDIRIAAGTARVFSALDVTVSPTRLFPPAEDVFLVE